MALDANDYARAPIITVATGVALADALLEAAPASPPPLVAKARDRLKSTADGARTALVERNRKLGTFTEEDSRIIDNEADHAWGGLRACLLAVAMLDHDKFPRARLAAELDKKLFAGGTEFLKADFPTQSTFMAAILERIDTDGLAAQIDEIVGKEFLQAIREIQPRYIAMVNERLRRDEVMGQSLLDMTRELQEAIAKYAQKLLGTIDDDDPATEEAVRVALVPIANHRARAASKRTTVDLPPPVTAPATTADPNKPGDPKKPA